MFYILSFRPAFVGNFLDNLWKIFTNVNTPSIIRQSAVAYIASLISRATFVKLPVMRKAKAKLNSTLKLFFPRSSFHAWKKFVNGFICTLGITSQMPQQME